MRSPVLLTCLALVPPTLAQHPHTSRTQARLLPLAKQEGVFHFVIFGDRTGGPAEGIEVLAQAVRDTNLLGPDLVMTVGDLVEGYNTTGAWMVQMREFKRVMDRLDCRWFPVAGNHDVYWRPRPDKNEKRPVGEHEAHYEKHFGPLWYWFEHKNAAFFVLYTDEGDPTDGSKGFQQPRHVQMSQQQLDWLERELPKAADKDHVFVFCHHPRWIEGQYRGSNWNEVHEVLRQAGNVSAVFGGHIHRMHYGGRRDGIEYFTLATTGGYKNQDLPGGGWLHHLNVVTVRKERLTFATIPVGAVMDPKTMTAEHLAEIDALLELVPEKPSGDVAVDANGGGGGRHAFSIRNPTDRPIELTATFEGAEGWAIRPDHMHAELKPGESKRFEIAYGRRPIGWRNFQEPRMWLQVDYLGKGMRIALPRTERRLATRITTLPPGFFDPAVHGALEVAGGAAVRVAAGKLRLPDGPMTVEAWLQPRNLDGPRALIAKTEDSEFGIFVSDGRPHFTVHLGGEYVSARGAPGQVVPGRWQHLAGVFDGRGLRLYLDGRLIAESEGGGERRRRNNPLYIGAEPDANQRPTSFFDGRIDEARISKTARYSGKSFEPRARHEPDADTVLLLHFDQDLGPFAPDHSPAQAHGMRLGPAKCVRIEKRRP